MAEGTFESEARVGAEAAAETRPTTGNWVAVGLMLLGFTICTVAFIAQIIWLGGIGLAIGLAGIITGKVTHLMRHTH
jgi:hypothetical protein